MGRYVEIKGDTLSVHTDEMEVDVPYPAKWRGVDILIVLKSDGSLEFWQKVNGEQSQRSLN